MGLCIFPLSFWTGTAPFSARFEKLKATANFCTWEGWQKGPVAELGFHLRLLQLSFLPAGNISIISFP